MLPVKLKMPAWFKIVNQSLESIQVVEIEAQFDTSPIVLLKRYIYEFLEERAKARTRMEVMNKRVYFDERWQEYWFRTTDLLEFLIVTKNFKAVEPSTINAVLRDIGCTKRQVKDERRISMRVTALSKQSVQQHLSVVLMEVSDETGGQDEQEGSIADLASLDEHSKKASEVYDAPQEMVEEEAGVDFATEAMDFDVLQEDLY